MKINKFTLFSLVWFVASIYMLFIKVPSNQAPPFLHFDKVVHFCLFFTQAWLIAKIWLSEKLAVPYVAIIILLTVWAGLSEILQSQLTTNRQGDILDTVADVMGACVALWLANQVRKNEQKLNQKN